MYTGNICLPSTVGNNATTAAYAIEHDAHANRAAAWGPHTYSEAPQSSGALPVGP